MGRTRSLDFFIALVSIATSQTAWALSPIEIDAARVRGLAFLFKSQNGDGSWSVHDRLKVQTTATALEAFINAGVNSGEAFGAASAWLANTETTSVDSTARKIAALAGTGMNMKSLAQDLLAMRTLSDRQVWGAYPQYGMSFPDTPLGIAAIRLSGYSYANQSNDLNNAVACEILPSQRSGGGWSYTRAPGESAANEPTGIGSSALLPTAITLLEVATLKATNKWVLSSCSEGGIYNLDTVLNNGVAYLQTKQNEADKGFGENGVSTPLETALAYLAIQAVSIGHDSLGPAQDYLIVGAGQQAADGSWGGNPLTTALVLKTLPMLSPNSLADNDHDGVPDKVEQALNSGTSAVRADGRGMNALGNGQSLPGVNASILAASLRYLHPMVPLQLGPAGATTITNGTLPPGITMDGTGALSGTPTQIGTFSFTYSGSNGTLTLAQLVVSPPDGDLNDDGLVDVADIALLERIMLGLSTATALQKVSADVSPATEPDGLVDLADLQRLKRMALGLE